MRLKLGPWFVPVIFCFVAVSPAFSQGTGSCAEDAPCGSIGACCRGRGSGPTSYGSAPATGSDWQARQAAAAAEMQKAAQEIARQWKEQVAEKAREEQERRESDRQRQRARQEEERRRRENAALRSATLPFAGIPTYESSPLSAPASHSATPATSGPRPASAPLMPLPTFDELLARGSNPSAVRVDRSGASEDDQAAALPTFDALMKRSKAAGTPAVSKPESN